MNLYAALRSRHGTLMQKKRARYIEGLQRKGLTLGRNIEIIESFFFDPSHCFLISIGDNCIICPNVRLIAHDASTKKHLGYTKIGRIDIRENCFIGDSAIVLPRVTIGPNAIIGAGAVVTRDVPPGMIAAGNPARIVGSVDEYLQRIATMSRDKRIFGEDYYIDRLDDIKRQEIIRSIGETIGFIV